MSGHMVTRRRCCACEREGYVRNMLCMDFEGPVGFVGWGCVQCGKPNRGAIAMVCDGCVDANRDPVSICAGQYVSDLILVSLEGFERVPFGHDISRHPELRTCPACRRQGTITESHCEVCGWEECNHEDDGEGTCLGCGAQL